MRKAAATALGRINTQEGREALTFAQGGGVKYVSDAASTALLPKVVGESHYQAVLAKIAVRSPLQGAATRATAELVPEPENPFDKNAVAVRIQGDTVGYLQRSDAEKYLRSPQRLQPVLFLHRRDPRWWWP